MSAQDLQIFIERYTKNLASVLDGYDWTPVHALAEELLECWRHGRQIFICGNGGSGANAVHIANDLIYGISKTFGHGLKCHALSSNNSVVTCLANDEGYESIFAYQLGVLAHKDDVLLTLSGSGNSPNIIEVIKVAKDRGIKTYGILGYSGGKAKDMVDTPIHFAIDDMQISEDLQMMVAHMISQWLYAQRNNVSAI